MAELRSIVNGVTNSADAADIINGNAQELAARAAAAQEAADDAIPAEEKGKAGGVAALDGNAELQYSVIKTTNTKPAVIAASTGTPQAQRVTLSLAAVVQGITGTGSSPAAYHLFYPSVPPVSNGMYSYRFRGYAHGTGVSQIEFVVTFFFQPSAGGIISPYAELRHFGNGVPPVSLGTHANGSPVVAVAVGGVGWRHVVLESALLSHSNATDDIIRSLTATTAADLSGLTGVVTLVDNGPVSRGGDTMNGQLVVRPNANMQFSVQNSNNIQVDYAASSNNPASITLRRARGSSAGSEALGVGDRIGILAFSGCLGGGSYSNDFALEGTATSAYTSATASGLRVFFSKKAAGSTGRQAVLSLNEDNSVSISTPTTVNSTVSVGSSSPIVLTGGAGGQINHVRTASGQIDISDVGQDATAAVNIRLHRNANTSGPVEFQLLRGNNTSQYSHRFASSGTGAPASTEYAEIAANGGRVSIGGAISGRTLRVYGATQVDGVLFPAQYTKATVPAASANTGGYIDVSDAAGGACLARSNGANWISQITGAAI